MKTLVPLAAFAAALAFAPGAVAVIGTGDFTGPLMPLLPPEAGAAGDMPVLYVTEDGSVYQESNGHDDLQTSPVVDEDGNEIAPADTTLFSSADIPA